MSYQKDGVFILQQALAAIYENDSNEAAKALNFFYHWGQDLPPALQAQAEPLLTAAEQFLSRRETGEELGPRDLRALTPPLLTVFEGWLDGLKLRLYYSNELPSREALPLNEANLDSITHIQRIWEVPEISDDSIQLLLLPREIEVKDSEWRVDAIITLPEIYTWANFCYPTDAFSYDRTYLAGKLASLSAARNDSEIVLAGSSYTMVGLQESRMPRPAINLAVNAQDPYFALLSVNEARKRCRKINTVVLSSAYYFWHLDMTDNPSDYLRSVLSRVNYPIFKKLRGYQGELLPPLRKSQSAPLFERFFDLAQAKEKHHKAAEQTLSGLEYFNQEWNPRPPYGMLRFDFHQQTDEANFQAAALRAQAHNGNFNPAHAAANLAEFERFLTQMAKKQIRVLLFVPPVTRFYRAASASELREVFYQQLEAVQQKHDFFFVDLFASEDYTTDDFQDYDHLNSQGAEKLSDYVAGLLEQLSSPTAEA